MNSGASRYSRLSALTLLEAGGAFAGGAFLAGAYFGMVGAVVGSLVGFVVVLTTSTNFAATAKPTGRNQAEKQGAVVR
jgi:hypothetical protein